MDMSLDPIFGLIGLFVILGVGVGVFLAARSLIRRAGEKKAPPRRENPGSFRWIRSFGPLELNLGWLGLAVVLAAGSSYIAETQRLHPNPYRNPAALTSDWWLHPLESNAHARSTIVTGDLHRIVLRPAETTQGDTAELWAAGSGGLLISSPDAGRTWRQAPISVGNPVYLHDGQALSVVDLKVAQTVIPNSDEIEEGIDFEIRALTDRRAQNENLLNSLQQDERNALEKLGVDAKLQALIVNQGERDPAELEKEFGVPTSAVEEIRRLAAAIVDARAAIANIDDAIAELESSSPALQNEEPAATPEIPARPSLAPEDHLTRGLRSIAFVGERGWAVGDHGAIVATGDGGATWSLAVVGNDGDRLYDIAFTPNGRRGWIVGTPGLFETRDGGDTWRARPLTDAEEVELRFVAVVAAPTRLGYWVMAGGQEGNLLVSDDGGGSWEGLEINDTASLNAVSLFRPQSAPDTSASDLGLIAVGEAGALMTASATIDPGQSSIADEPSEAVYNLAGDRELNGLWMDGTPRTFWAVGAQGLVIRGVHGNNPQEPLEQLEVRQPLPGLTVDFHDIVFDRDSAQGWIVGADGTILHSADSGATWTRTAYGKTSVVAAVTSSPDNALAKIFKVDGKDLQLAAGGEADSPEILKASHSVYPAPWYYLSWALVLGFAGLAIRPQSPPPPTSGIDDRGVADRPLEYGDRDPLNFGAIALAISNFVINENTEPPLTIAISGDWGSGKSSILNLVKHNLKTARRRPIWFNAWHHQNAESLLAALLETIRREAIPPWWQPSGWIFLVHLLRVRFRRDPFWLSILLLLCAFAAGHFLVVPPLQLVPYYKSMLGGLLGGGSAQTGSLADSSPLIAGAIGVIGLWFKLNSSFGASGFSLSRLLGGGGIRADDIRSRVGFRHQFAREFEDVTEALGRMHMVIMIDDLDRCQAKNIMETLELMNFLVTSGKCFILVGLAPKQVMKLIKGEMEGDTDPKHYLEKLINIEIPVPTLRPEDRSKLISEFVNQDQTARPARVDRGRRLEVGAYATVFFVLAMCLAYLGNYLGGTISDDVKKFLAKGEAPEEAPEEVVQVVLVGEDGQRLLDVPQSGTALSEMIGRQTSPTQTTGTAKGPEVTVEPVEPVGEGSAPGPEKVEQTAPAPRAHLVSGARGPWSYIPTITLWILALFICAVTALEQMRRSAVGVVQDSETFQKALTTWDLLIQHGNTTPRALKRFMNKLRFLAMRQRALQPGGGAAAGNADASMADGEIDAIPEPALVALSAIENFNPKLLDELEAKKGYQEILDQIGEPEIKKRLSGSDRYAKLAWPCLVKRYRRLGTVVRTDLEEVSEPAANGQADPGNGPARPPQQDAGQGALASVALDPKPSA